ncbi:unnamed protein product [Plutella xylostella]|uniref:(diamondback moth) hypothetical protein n=1 Tax=Plutella xylostella TaxID=51655 RepID=A0A8S4E2Q1_PLUXY|nr:unnamed protein product [Plutella xylostella]
MKYGSCEDTVTVREPPAPPTNRIVGGRPTTVETYPYTAYLVSHYTVLLLYQTHRHSMQASFGACQREQ